jgi:glycosyltransferase involved in cell wall biosynthesis
MILLDAIYINNSGGKILLDYLIIELEKLNLEIVYLLDERIKSNHPEIVRNKVIYQNKSFTERFKFYRKNKNSFKSVLCFGNIPPFVKPNAIVFTYFHQALFLKQNNTYSLYSKQLFKIKSWVINLFKSNTNFWIVQTNYIKNELANKFKLDLVIIKTLPFFEVPDLTPKKFERKEFSFAFVSSAYSHKNHINLINAFKKFYDKHKIGKLILTVDKQFESVYQLIEKTKKNGYPIENVGFVSKHVVYQIYNKSKFCVYPSLSESFGLGLIEAYECGCKLLCADLNYTHQIIEPSVLFNPKDVDSIFQALEQTLDSNMNDSQLKVKNNINEIITLLTC